MLDRSQSNPTRTMDSETAAPSYEPPTIVSFGDAVARTMGDEGNFAEKKAIAGLLGSGG